MKYIVRDKIYTEEFFDNLKLILENNITGPLQPLKNVIIN